MKLDPTARAYIDSLDVFHLLERQRNAPAGDPWFEGETGDYWMDRLAELRTLDNVAYVRASKEIGWG